MTSFAITSEPLSSLSRTDCSDSENVRDAVHQLRRCASDADYRAWGQTWGESLCRTAEEHSGSSEMVSADDMEEVEAEATAAKDSLSELRLAVDRAVAAMDDAMEGATGERADKVLAIVSKLESALS